MSEAREIWKSLFFLLRENKQPDDTLPKMWVQFKECDIEDVLESIEDQIPENVKKGLKKLREDARNGAASLSYLMKTSPLLCDNFWRLLFSEIRDRACHPIDLNTTVPIVEGGFTKHMTMEDIEKKFASENPNILTSFESVPDQMIHEDLIDAHFNTDSVKESLRMAYGTKLSEAKATLLTANPKLKPEEVEKQAAAQAKKEMKESSEAKLLQNRVAMMAEDKVQKSIRRAMKQFNIPVFVFRGVNTYDDIGKFVENFGIKLSKLKAIKDGGTGSTLECEPDIGAVALPPSGPLVSFVEVLIIRFIT